MRTHFRLKIDAHEDWLMIYVRPPGWLLWLAWPILRRLPYYRRLAA